MYADARSQEADDTRRFVQVLVVTLLAMPVLTLLVTVVIAIQVPDWGVGGALAIGAMVGFWVSIFFGSLIGNTVHELGSRRRAAASEPPRPIAHAGVVSPSGAQVAQAAVEQRTDLAA